MKILLIDDEPALLEVLEEFLLLNRHEVTLAKNGEEGWEAFLKAPETFDVIMTDIKMPMLDGLELLERIRQHDYSTPVIVMTGHGGLDLALRALKLGAFDYLMKPINLNHLSSVLSKLHSIQIPKEELRTIIPFSQGSFEIAIPSQTQLVSGVVGLLNFFFKPLCQLYAINSNDLIVSLHEALRNAMIHGNLEIQVSDEEYWKPLEASIREKEAIAEFGERKIMVRYALKMVPDSDTNSIGTLTFEIQDSGKGFDRGSLPDFTDPISLTTPGRGLILIHSFMDKVSWNDSGNCIKMLKYIRVRVE